MVSIKLLEFLRPVVAKSKNQMAAFPYIVKCNLITIMVLMVAFIDVAKYLQEIKIN